MKKYNFDTISLHAGRTANNEQAIATPIYQTSAYEFDSAEQAANRFGLAEGGNIYSRLTNPTQSVIEQRISQLENGKDAIAFASGTAAIFGAILAVCESGSHIVASNALYGGTSTLLSTTLKPYGISVTFVDITNEEEIRNAICDNTVILYTETIGNPTGVVADISLLANIANEEKLLFYVDNTFATPYLCRPIDLGAHVVLHSATKFIGGHGTTLGGLLVDGGNYDKSSPRYSNKLNNVEQYHGADFTSFDAPIALLARTVILRDFGACISPFNAFLLIQGIETLSLRVQRHVENTLALAKYFESHDLVNKVHYASLESNSQFELANKILPKGAGSIISVEVDGNREQVAQIIENLELFIHCANLGEVKSLIVHPASTTHSQWSSEQLTAAGISEGLIRLSVGIEDINDLIADFDQALNKLKDEN